MAYVFNPDLSQRAIQKQQASSQRVQATNAAGEGFQGVLSNLLHRPEAVESAIAAEEKNIRKKKKDTKEILADYKKLKEETYDVLDLEAKIRKTFRKIRLEI
ncbi:MAG: hypothetical protein AABZ14_02020 [Candidatus Margulisiibacteriota bacterium]